MRHITILLPLLLVLTAACGEERSERGSGGEGEGEGEGEGPAEGEGEGPAEGEGEGPAEGEGEGAAALVLCDGTPDATPGADVCAVRPGDDRLVIVGDVLALDTVHEDGAVVLDADGRITCVGCECDTAGATQVICPEAVVSPGLINMHDHMGWMADPPFDPQAAEIDPKVRWEHRHDWRKGKRGNPKITTKGRSSRDDKHFGELRFVLGGATAINGSGSAPGLLRNLDDRNGNTTVDEIDQPAAAYDTFPLDDAGGSLHAWDCDYGSKYKEGQKDPPASNPYTFHISEGIDDEARNEFLCLVSEERGGRDSLDSRVGIIHAVGVLAPDVYLMAQRGMKLIWSPRTNISLYGDTTPVTLFDTLGIPIGLGTDWMPSGSMNMLRELRCADDFNRVNLGGWFSDEDLWRMATVDGARSINMEDAIGALAIGLVGDIAVFANSGRRHYRAVIDANPGDVALVLRGGEVLAGNAAVVEALESGCDPIDDVCGSAKQVCLQREIGKTYAQLLSAVGDNYGLFHCDVPPNEPSCLPARVLAEDSVDGSSLYTGMSLEADPDGDGIEGDDDNCPTVFNPRRPLDGAFQADYDCDGEGDVCDSTPLGDDPTTPRPMDRDCDGVPDADDNCPVDANDQQEDGDGDDKGDACDPCPADANPGDQGCPTTIYDAKTNAAQMGRRVAMADMVVTAVNPEGGIFLQLDPDSADYVGPEHSGIWVYMGDAEKPAQWDVLAVHGAEVAEWYDQIELTGLDYEVVAQREPIPPHVLDADGVTQMVADQASSPWESLVVRVEGVEVTNAAPEAGPGDDGANEFEVTGGLRVDDGLFLIDPLPEAGEVFTFLVGPVPFKNGHMKLLPRADSDVGFGVAALASFGPETSFARVGGQGDAFPEPFTVSLMRPAGEEVVVTVGTSDEAVAVVAGGQVTIAPGERSTTVPVHGLGAGTATLSARLAAEDDPLEVTVRVLAVDEAPTALTLDPAEATAPMAAPFPFTVCLDIPAPEGGAVVGLEATGDVGTVPATVTVELDALCAPFELQAAEAEAVGTVVATLGALDPAVAQVEVIAGGADLVINEVDYDQPSTDTAEFLEVFNGTAAPVPLAGLQVLLVNGNNNSVYETIDLAGAGEALPARSYLVVAAAEVEVAGGALTMVLDGSIQNGGPDGLALFDSNAGEVLDAVSYEGSIDAAQIGGGAVSLVEGAAMEASDSGGGSLCRLPNGADTDDAATDWALCDTPTPGASND